MFTLRRSSTRLATRLHRPTAHRAAFHASATHFVKVGDSIPDVELMEGSPGNKVNLAQELKGNGLIIGVPAAYCENHPLLLASAPQ